MILPLQSISSGELAARLQKGQYFNAYELASGAIRVFGFVVGLGPVSDLLGLYAVDDAAEANALVEILREATGPDRLTLRDDAVRAHWRAISDPSGLAR